MNAIIGLGNPGTSYARTRHNVGFLVVDALAKKLGAQFANKRALQAQVAQVEGARLLLVKPQTFMNVSGKAVAATMKKWSFKPADVLIVYDDADLPFGDVRFKVGGSSAGHRGMESILGSVGRQPAIARVRVGIGRPTNPDVPLEDFVLGKWTKVEEEALPEIIDRAIGHIETFIAPHAV